MTARKPATTPPAIPKCVLQTTTYAFSPHHKEPESRIYQWSEPDKIPRAHSEVTRIAPALPGRIATLIALSVPISVVLIATPPEETRNWADADQVVPNAVPPEETVSRPPPPDVSLPTRDAEIDVPPERNRLRKPLPTRSRPHMARPRSADRRPMLLPRLSDPGGALMSPLGGFAILFIIFSTVR